MGMSFIQMAQRLERTSMSAGSASSPLSNPFKTYVKDIFLRSTKNSNRVCQLLNYILVITYCQHIGEWHSLNYAVGARQSSREGNVCYKKKLVGTKISLKLNVLHGNGYF